MLCAVVVITDVVMLCAVVVITDVVMLCAVVDLAYECFGFNIV
jgi:hypothetical protein